MTQRERNTAILQKYIPQPAAEIAAGWIYEYDFKLKIRRSRATKLGDYRSPLKDTNHQITINNDLNPYSFLITLVHEVAHLVAFKKYGNRVKPHGKEWKNEYKVLLQYFLHTDYFPVEVVAALKKHLASPTASSCTDDHLSRVLKKFDRNTGTVLLEQLPALSAFTHSGRKYIKLRKIRKRFLCREITSKREFLFSPVAEVTAGQPALFPDL